MGFWPAEQPPHTPTKGRDELEADIRKEMARHAAIQPRGFDSIKERQAIHRLIDTYFDHYAVFVALDALDGTPLTAVGLVTGMTADEIAELGGL